MSRPCPDCDGEGWTKIHPEDGRLGIWDCQRCDGTGRIPILDRLRRAAHDGLRGR